MVERNAPAPLRHDCSAEGCPHQATSQLVYYKPEPNFWFVTKPYCLNHASFKQRQLTNDGAFPVRLEVLR